MQLEKRTPTHPGEILRADFLETLGQSQIALAEHLVCPSRESTSWCAVRVA